MLHDIEESKRTNNLISSAFNTQIHQSKQQTQHAQVQVQAMMVDSTTTTSNASNNAAVSTTINTNNTGTDTSNPSTTTSKLTDSDKLLILNKYGLHTGTEIDFSIISDNYWPQLSQFDDEYNFQPHPDASALIDMYHCIYQDIKKPRKLNIFNHIGQVYLELEFDNNSIRKFSVSPIQATLIMYVSEGNTCTHNTNNDCEQQDEEMIEASNKYITDTKLSQLTNIPIEDIRRKMIFWINAGVVGVHHNTSSSLQECRYYALDIPLPRRGRNNKSNTNDTDEKNNEEEEDEDEDAMIIENENDDLYNTVSVIFRFILYHYSFCLVLANIIITTNLFILPLFSISSV